MDNNTKEVLELLIAVFAVAGLIWFVTGALQWVVGATAYAQPQAQETHHVHMHYYDSNEHDDFDDDNEPDEDEEKENASWN